MKALNSKHIRMAAADTYKELMVWTLWALGIFIVIISLAAVFISEVRSPHRSALNMVNNAAQIYMAIIGVIIGYYSLRYYIRHGVTRMNYLIGTAAAAVMVALTIQGIGLVLTFLSFALEAFTPITAGRQLSLLMGQQWGYLPTVAAALAILTVYFFQGWIMGFCFYRFSALGGFPSILSGIAILGFTSSLWGESHTMTILRFTFTIPYVTSFAAALLITLLIIAVQASALFLLIRKTPVAVQ